MSYTYIGTVQVYENPNSTEKTAGQIILGTQYDSRIHQRIYPLTYKKIRELRNDPTIQLARWAVLSPMIHTPWVYEASKLGKAKATEEMVDCVRDSLEPLRDWFLQKAVFGTLDFGWQPFEVIFAPLEGKIQITNFKALLQDFTDILVYLDTGGFAGFVNEPIIPMSASVILNPYALNINFSVEGTDWYGYSVFEAIKCVSDSWNAVESTSTRYDKKIAGATWVVYYPVGETLYNGTRTANDEIANDLIKKLEGSGGVAIPDDVVSWMDGVNRDKMGKWRLEIVEAKTTSQLAFIDRQKYLDALKMRAFGFPERSILEGKHGTKEDAAEHADVALSIVDSRHRLLTDQLNNGPVKTILRLNYGEKYASCVHVKPAPLVDSQFAMLKDFYRTILQTPDALLQEAANMDMKGIRDALGVPSSGVNEPILPMPETEPVKVAA